MELLLLATVGTGLAKVWSECCSANFTAGIIGNLLASIGYDHVVKNQTEAALKRLRDLVRSGVTQENHDLLRALWAAQNEALVLACEHVLKAKKGLRPGGLAIPEELANFGAWLGTINDAETRSLLALRAAAIGHARRATKTEIDEILPRLAARLAEVPDLFRAGSEFSDAAQVSASEGDMPSPGEGFRKVSFSTSAITGDSLHIRATEQFIEALRRQHPEVLQGMHLTACLEECLRERWFDFLRLAFREVLKTDENAKAAFQFMVWEQIAGLDLKLDDALRRLEHFDWALDQLYQHVRWLVEAVEVAHQEIGVQHVETREQIEKLQRTIDSHTRVQKAEGNLSAALDALRARVEFFHTRFPVLEAAEARRVEGRSLESFLLSPEARSLPVLGRAGEFARLWNWVHQPGPVSVCVCRRRTRRGQDPSRLRTPAHASTGEEWNQRRHGSRHGLASAVVHRESTGGFAPRLRQKQGLGVMGLGPSHGAARRLRARSP